MRVRRLLQVQGGKVRFGLRLCSQDREKLADLGYIL